MNWLTLTIKRKRQIKDIFDKWYRSNPSPTACTESTFGVHSLPRHRSSLLIGWRAGNMNELLNLAQLLTCQAFTSRLPGC